MAISGSLNLKFNTNPFVSPLLPSAHLLMLRGVGGIHSCSSVGHIVELVWIPSIAVGIVCRILVLPC